MHVLFSRVLTSRKHHVTATFGKAFGQLLALNSICLAWIWWDETRNSRPKCLMCCELWVLCCWGHSLESFRCLSCLRNIVCKVKPMHDCNTLKKTSLWHMFLQNLWLKVPWTHLFWGEYTIGIGSFGTTSFLFVSYMGVSKNGGTPKSWILIVFSLINHPFGGSPIFGNTHIFL